MTERVYEVEWFGIRAFISATSAGRAKQRAMLSAKESGYWSSGKSLAGLKCRLAKYVPPNEAVLYGR